MADHYCKVEDNCQSYSSSSQVVVYTLKCPNTPRPLAVKNSLPYLSRNLFWEALPDISKNTNLVASYPLTQLREIAQQQKQGCSLLVHAVKDVQMAALTTIILNHPKRTRACLPSKTAVEIAGKLMKLQPVRNDNRLRLSKTAKTLISRA